MTKPSTPSPLPDPSEAEAQTALDIRLASEVLDIARRLGYQVRPPRAAGRPSTHPDPRTLAANAALGRAIRSAVATYCAS